MNSNRAVLRDADERGSTPLGAALDIVVADHGEVF